MGEITLESLQKAIQTGFSAVAEDMADLRQEMIDQFEHFDKRFSDVEARFNDSDGRLNEIIREIAAIHRKVDRLEDQGASNAGFAKEIDMLIARIGELEKEVAELKK
jgi:chromosome segregation ATPase